MISDIEKGEARSVIVKDQSRLGRDHLMTGYYMDVFFPEHDVHFVAIYDNYDSEIGDNEFVPVLKNKLCKCIFQLKKSRLKKQSKRGDAEERLNAGCGILRRRAAV